MLFPAGQAAVAPTQVASAKARRRGGCHTVPFDVRADRPPPASAAMYLDHYGLREPPFAITPDPRFVFLSERHRDALAHLLFGIGQGGGGGFVQLTGEVGTGKTTLSRLLLEQLPANARVALVLNPLLAPVELLETICEELHLELDGRRGNLKALVDTLNAHLLAAHASGLRVVLIIDEAQNLSPAALEQVRLLTNLETPTQKLLQIILLGQPELRAMLARPDLRQLAQRITARYHLAPLDPRESEGYLRHRWAVAGGGAFPFTTAAVRHLHRRADGIPRLLNVIADRALLASYARGARMIDGALLDRAASEVRPALPRARPRWLGITAATLVTIVIIGVTLGLILRGTSRDPATRTTAGADARHPPVSATATQTTPAAATANAPQAGITPLRALPTLDGDGLHRWLMASNGRPDSAWHDLLALSALHADAPMADAPSPCATLNTSGVLCASGRQRLSLLAQFDRPALLRLRQEDHAAWLVLLGVGPTQALVRIDGRDLRVRRAVLEPMLDGYVMIAPIPPMLTLPIKRGDGGAGVTWLRTLLNTPAGATYDAALVDAVRMRQRDFGLHADGVVGPETALALLASERDGPHLQRLPE